MSGISIRGRRNLEGGRVEAVAALIGLVWPGYQPLFRREIQAYAAYPDLFAPFFAVAEDAGSVVGFSLLIASMMSTDLDIISWVGVNFDQRGSGLGRRLVMLCAAEAQRRGKSVVLSTTVPGFYEKLGLRVLGAYDQAREHFLVAENRASQQLP
jgi:GNAT superfamily N-acetyltransferase